LLYNSNKNGFKSYFQKILIRAMPIMSASYSLFISTLILSALGYFIDKNFNTFPIIFLISLFFGMIVGFYQLARKIGPKNK
jgi:F0F1-type ATP synthase assembly protein I|tara:strand:+ start:1236 stop:1478 length:243 start_codon:yes stop_codon:yes gene_type:complete